jgi:excisionase family DNA binding protein
MIGLLENHACNAELVTGAQLVETPFFAIDIPVLFCVACGAAIGSRRVVQMLDTVQKAQVGSRGRIPDRARKAIVGLLGGPLPPERLDGYVLHVLTTSDGEEQMTASAMAKMLGVRPGYIYSAIKRRKIPHMKMDGHILLSLAAVERRLSQEQNGGS